MTQPAPTPTQPTPGDPAAAPINPAPTPAPGPAPAPTAPPTPADDKPLGPGGEKALAAEREARKALEKKYAPLDALLAAMNGGQKPPEGKSEVELLQDRFAEHEKAIADERGARWRAEIANEKGLTAQQAARLNGATRDELLADADALLALFPTATGPRTPLPDPTQGARGGTPGPDIDARVAEARGRGDFRAAIALERQKLIGVSRPT